MKFVVYGAFEMFSVFSLYFAIYFRPPITQSMLNMDWEGQMGQDNSHTLGTRCLWKLRNNGNVCVDVY